MEEKVRLERRLKERANRMRSIQRAVDGMIASGYVSVLADEAGLVKTSWRGKGASRKRGTPRFRLLDRLPANPFIGPFGAKT